MPPIFVPKIVKKHSGMLAFFGFPSSAKNDDFKCLEGTFRHLFGTLEHHFADLGSPRGSTEDPWVSRFRSFDVFGEFW